MRDTGSDTVTPGGLPAPPGHVGGPRGHIVAVSLVGLLALAAFLALAAGYLHAGALVDLDVRISRWVAGRMPAPAEWAARPFTWAGGIAVTPVVAVAAAALLWHARRRADAVLVAASLVGVQILVAVLKASFERSRPDAGSAIPLPHSYSFPSGHAATAAALYGALTVLAVEQARTRAARIACTVTGAALVLAIGASRVILDVHYLSDVLAGFAVGVAWLCACLLGRELLARHGR